MISSIICVKRPGSEFRDAWIGSGKQVRDSPEFSTPDRLPTVRQILRFRLDTPELIQTYDDALETILAIPDSDDEDEVQDVRYSPFPRPTKETQKYQLAFSQLG